MFLAAVLCVSGRDAGASPGPAGRCACELVAEDGAGRTLLQTVAYALDRPGILMTSLTTLERGGHGWESLRAAPDPRLGGAPSGPSFPITEVLEADPTRDRLLLRAPGLEACAQAAAPPAGGGARAAAGPAPAVGASLVGIRERDGYRPRVFGARLERWIDTGPGPGLMLVRILDGGGASTGVLLDGEDRLVGAIVPPPAGADRSLAVALPAETSGAGAAQQGDAVAPLDSLRLGQAPRDFGATPIGTLARALLLTRPDQVDQALGLLDKVASAAGEFEGLLMERGALLYRAGRAEEAIGVFARVVDARPDLHLAQYNLGVALGVAGRHAEAAEAFARAASLEPRNARTRYQLALALVAENRGGEARRECDSLDALDPALAHELRTLLGF